MRSRLELKTLHPEGCIRDFAFRVCATFNRAKSGDCASIGDAADRDARFSANSFQPQERRALGGLHNTRSERCRLVFGIQAFGRLVLNRSSGHTEGGDLTQMVDLERTRARVTDAVWIQQGTGYGLGCDGGGGIAPMARYARLFPAGSAGGCKGDRADGTLCKLAPCEKRWRLEGGSRPLGAMRGRSPRGGCRS